MKEQDAENEERRRQAFLEYQKTGKMNEIVAAEFVAYAKEENTGNKRLVYVVLALFLLLYFGIFALILWKFLQTFHFGWGFLCICYGFVTGIAVYVVVQMAKRRRKRR